MPVPRHEAKAQLFRTLGHPVRIRVLELLCEREHAVHELLASLEEAGRQDEGLMERDSGFV